MTQPHVGIRADATAAMGVGHVVRCLALAEELLARRCAVTLLGTVTVEWISRVIDTSPISVVRAPEAADEVVALAGELGIDALVIDGYDLDPDLGARARAFGMTVLALHDGAFGAEQDADIYVDQNFGAEPHPAGRRGRVALAGLQNALFRNEVLELGRHPRSEPERAAVLTVFGGTDPYGAGEVVAPLLLATGVPMDLTCIVARPEMRGVIEGLDRTSQQTVRALAPAPDVMRRAFNSTVTVSAAGSSIWELLYLRVPTGIVAVADNQVAAYGDVTRQGVAAAVGTLAELRESAAARASATSVLHHLITDAGYHRKLSDRARLLVDGLGRRRVVDALFAHASRHPD